MSIISYDERGLPVAEWRESNLTAAHRCWISVDADGVPRFCYQNPRPGHIKRDLERLEQMDPVQIGAAVLRGEFPWHRVLIIAGLAIGLLVLCWILTALTGDPLAFLYVLLGMPLLAAPFIIGFAIWRFVRVRKGHSHEGIEVFAAPWTELESFRVADEKSVLGHVRRDEKGMEQPPQSMLIADFGLRRAPLEISGWFNVGVLNVMHGELSDAFVDKRPQHLERLSRELRRQTSPQAQMTVRGGRIPAEELGSFRKEDEEPEAFNPEHTYSIPFTEAKDPSDPTIWALLPLRTRSGEVAFQNVQINIYEENGIKTIVAIGVPMEAVTIGAHDYFAEAPLDRIAGISMVRAATWRDARFSEFIFERDEHVLLLNIVGTGQQELLARSGVGSADDLEKIGASLTRAIEGARTGTDRKVAKERAKVI
jgi:hypothetical protein